MEQGVTVSFSLVQRYPRLAATHLVVLEALHMLLLLWLQWTMETTSMVVLVVVTSGHARTANVVTSLVTAFRSRPTPKVQFSGTCGDDSPCRKI